MNNLNNRQIILDTETTGISTVGPHYQGHRIIEIGAVEIINRQITKNKFHTYINPNRSVDPEAFKIHGISDQFLADKPNFKIIANNFINYIKNTEIIIHNASFDVGFINNELTISQLSIAKIESFCKITDSLALARQLFPGKRNSLDILCSRYKINKDQRKLHSALLDAELLAKVYLAMTGGQTMLNFSFQKEKLHINNKLYKKEFSKKNHQLIVIKANDQELDAHQAKLNEIEKTNGNCIWKKW